MKYHWQYRMSQWFRRYGKTAVFICLFLSFMFIGHMMICVPNSYEDLSRGTRGGTSYYSTLAKIGEPKQHKTFLLVVILTGPAYFDRRRAIRETWLDQQPEDVLCFFVIGTRDLPSEDKTALEYEKRQFNDLLLLNDFKDSYFDLTAKVVRTFQWIDANVDFQYVFKADDDTYARIDMIKEQLRERRWAERFYWGFFDGRARVKKTGQWAEKNWILCDTYLPHARGGGYVLSKDLVQYIAINAHILKQFNSEDISVGAWLGPLNVERLHDPRFDTEYRSRGCNNAYIVTHKQDPKEMREKHDLLTNGGVLCSNEFKTRNSYNYNWDVPPSGCCIRDDPTVP